jgi:hypothetical protein
VVLGDAFSATSHEQGVAPLLEVGEAIRHGD